MMISQLQVASRLRLSISSKVWALSGTLLALMAVTLSVIVYQIGGSSVLLGEQATLIKEQNSLLETTVYSRRRTAPEV